MPKPSIPITTLLKPKSVSAYSVSHRHAYLLKVEWWICRERLEKLAVAIILITFFQHTHLNTPKPTNKKRTKNLCVVGSLFPLI